MKHSLRTLAPGSFLLTALLALGACSDGGNEPGPSGPNGSDAGANGDGGSNGTDPCQGDPDREGAVCVETLDVTLVDEEGEPIEGVTVFCCGTDICSAPIATDAEGKAHIEVNSYMLKPAFKVAGEGKYISFAAPLPEGETKAVFPPTTLVALPEEGVAFEIGTDQTLTSNDVTLEITSDTDVFIDELTLPDEEDQLFKAVQIPLDKAPPIGSPEGGSLDAMFGLAPLATTFDPPAKLSLPNPQGWPAGTKVRVFAHGVEIASEHAPYAGWGELEADAVVAEDGTSVVLEAGTPLLTTIGLRKE